MMCFKDRTYCASPGCVNACGRKITDEEREEAKKSGLLVAVGMFCGDYLPDEKDFNDAATQQPED